MSPSGSSTSPSSAGFPERRLRRLRRTPALRRLVAETRLYPANLVQPYFVAEGLTQPRELTLMPGVVQHTRDGRELWGHERYADEPSPASLYPRRR